MLREIHAAVSLLCGGGSDSRYFRACSTCPRRTINCTRMNRRLHSAVAFCWPVMHSMPGSTSGQAASTSRKRMKSRARFAEHSGRICTLAPGDDRSARTSPPPRNNKLAQSPTSADLAALTTCVCGFGRAGLRIVCGGDFGLPLPTGPVEATGVALRC